MNNYTPLATLTDDELILAVCNKQETTDLELELMHRLDYWMEYAAALGEQLEVDVHQKVATRYVRESMAA